MSHEKFIQKCYALRDVRASVGSWLSEQSRLTYLHILSVKQAATDTHRHACGVAKGQMTSLTIFFFIFCTLSNVWALTAEVFAFPSRKHRRCHSLAYCFTDSVAPVVERCPGDVIAVDSLYPNAYVSWPDPVFTGEVVSVSATHQPGEYPRLLF